MSSGRKEAKKARKSAEEERKRADAERAKLEKQAEAEREKAQRLFIRQLRSRVGGGFFDQDSSSTLG